MGSAIDNFLSSMGGGVKKKSNVAPVGMANGGYVTARSGFDGSEIKNLKTRVDRNSRGPASADYYGDSYGDNSSGSYNNEYNFHSTDPADAPVFPDVSSSGFFDREPEPVGLTSSLRPRLRPASFDPYVNNAISSVQNNYNDGSVGPTMQNSLSNFSPYPAPIPDRTPDYNSATQYLGPNNKVMDYGPSVDDRYAIDMTKYVPLGLRPLAQSVFDMDFSSFNPLAGYYRGAEASGRIGKSIREGEEVDNNDLLTAGIETAIPALTLGLGRYFQQPLKQVVGNLFGIDVAKPQNATNIKPSNETLTFYKGSPVAYAPEPGFPFGRDRSDYSGTGEGNQKMLTPEALGEVDDVLSGKFRGAGAYQSESPGTGTGYRFMRSGLSHALQDDAVKAAQDRVDFTDAGGRPDNFQTFFSEKIDGVNNTVKDARLAVNSAEDAFAKENKTAAEYILKSNVFDTSKFKGDPRREIDPKGFYRSVISDVGDTIDNELYAIRDLTSNRGSMDYSDPEYVKMRSNLTEKFPKLASLSPKQLVERRAELNDLKKQYTGGVNEKYIDLTQTFGKDQDARQAQANLNDFEVAVTGDLPGVLYKTEIPEGKLGSSFEYGNPADNQILTQATNALGVDAMNAKLFGIGPEAKKLQYNPKTQQYSLPLGARGQKVALDERMLAPKTVAEAELYYKGGITHGQHTDRGGVTNKIFFSDPVTPVPVARYNRGGKVGMGLGSR